MTFDEKTGNGSAARRESASRALEGACRADDIVLTSPTLRLEMVDAHRYPDIAEACYHSKLACYARFGAAAASVPFTGCRAREDLHLVTATDCATGAIVGSVSIYRRTRGKRLPIESAIGHEAPMRTEIASWRGRCVAEMSGLWAEDVWRKTGLSEQLLQATIAACHVLKADEIVAFGHQHLIRFYETVGLLPKSHLGQFAYPDPRYVSTVMWADPLDFLTVPVDRRPAVLGFAKTIAAGDAIVWRSFSTRFALQ